MIKDIHASVVENSTGRIVMQFTNATPAMIEANMPKNCTAIYEKAPEHLAYWDFDQGQFVLAGDQPNQFSAFDFESKQWVDSRTLEQVQEQQWNKIKRERNLVEFGGFEFEGNVYDSDTTSQGRIVAAASLGVAVEWTLKNNSTVWLEPEQLKALQLALATHVTTTHARGKAAREAIYAATTKEQVEAVLF